MKRVVPLLLVLGLLLSPLAVSCGSGWSALEDTWLSAGAAPFSYLVRTRIDNGFERQYADLYRAAVRRNRSLADRLVRDVRGMAQPLDRLQQSVLELVDAALTDGRLPADGAAPVLAAMAGRRAYLDAILARLNDLRRMGSPTEYEAALRHLGLAYLGSLAGQVAAEHAVFLLDLAEFLPLLAGASPQDSLQDAVSSVESVFTREAAPRLARIDSLLEAIDLSVGLVEDAVDARHAYCLGEIDTALDGLEADLQAYRGRKDLPGVLLGRMEEDLAIFRSLVAADGSASLPIVRLSAIAQAPVDVALSSLREARSIAPGSTSPTADDYVAASRAAAPTAAATFAADPESYLASTLARGVSTPSRAPADPLVRQYENFYRIMTSDTTYIGPVTPLPTITPTPAEPMGPTVTPTVTLTPVPSSGTSPFPTPIPSGEGSGPPAVLPMKEDRQNAARILDTVRQYQAALRDRLQPRTGFGALADSIAGGVVRHIPIDVVLDQLTQVVEGLVQERSDKDDLLRYTQQNIRLYIRDRLGSDWYNYVLYLTYQNAQDLVDRFNEWFASTPNRDTFRFTRNEVDLLLLSLIRVRGPASGGNTGPTPSPGPSGGPSPSPGPGGGGEFDLVADIGEAADVTWTLPARDILRILFGWQDPYGDAAGPDDYGWHKDPTGTYDVYYRHERYEIDVSGDAEGHVYRIGTRRTDDKAVNGRYLFVEFDREGRLMQAEDGRFLNLSGLVGLEGRNTWIPQTLVLLGKPSGRGRRFLYRSGVPSEEYGYDGDTAYSRRFDAEGRLAWEAEYARTDPGTYQEGAYKPREADAKYYDMDWYRVFAIQGESREYDARQVLRWRARHVNGVPEGLLESFYDDGSLDFSAVLQNGIREGAFVKFERAETGEYYRLAEGAYAGGRRSGTWTFFQPDGDLSCRVTYQDGRPNGPATDYNEDGSVAAEGSFDEGTPSATWKRYDEAGLLLGDANPHRVNLFQHEIDEFFVVLIIEWD